MKRKKVAIVGVGLIGGSMALQLNARGLATRIVGVEASPEHARQAMERGLVDAILPLDEAIREAEFIVLAIPMDQLQELLPAVLDQLDQQIVIDVGSVKTPIMELVKDHPKRGRFVSTHPMWGTEYSGPLAAVEGAFEKKGVVLCNPEESDADALEWVRYAYQKIGMHVLSMQASNHDVHTAYISHISHITSFALANTVLEKEKEEDAIFELASTGFESTVRLAKSTASMWVPIFMQNKENVLDVLNEHITQLRKFKASLEKENWEYMTELIENANKIRKIIE